MNNLSLLQKKYAMIRMREAVEKLIAEGIISLKQAEEIQQLNAQLIGIK